MASIPQPQLPKGLTTDNIEIYKQAVRYILTEWPSLQLAIDQGQGGAQANAKRDWICQTIAQLMIDGKDIDLEDYLGEMINQEFDTLIEDGSLEYNAKWIEKFYKDCLQGQGEQVLEQIKQASVKKLSLGNMKIPAPVCHTAEESSEEETTDDEAGDDMQH